jgi:hypothetical protein
MSALGHSEAFLTRWFIDLDLSKLIALDFGVGSANAACESFR